MIIRENSHCLLPTKVDIFLESNTKIFYFFVSSLQIYTKLAPNLSLITL